MSSCLDVDISSSSDIYAIYIPLFLFCALGLLISISGFLSNLPARLLGEFPHCMPFYFVHVFVHITDPMARLQSQALWRYFNTTPGLPPLLSSNSLNNKHSGLCTTPGGLAAAFLFLPCSGTVTVWSGWMQWSRQGLPCCLETIASGAGFSPHTPKQLPLPIFLLSPNLGGQCGDPCLSNFLCLLPLLLFSSSLLCFLP